MSILTQKNQMQNYNICDSIFQGHSVLLPCLHVVFLLVHVLWNKWFLWWSQSYMCYGYIWNFQLWFLVILISRCPRVGWTCLHWWLSIWMKLGHLGMLLWGCLKCIKLLALSWLCNFKLYWKKMAWFTMWLLLWKIKAISLELWL